MSGQAAAVDSGSPSIDSWIDAHRDELLGLYTHLHTHPELSYQEVETSRRIADELRQAGAKVTTGVGKLGVVGVLKNGPGPAVLVRTDMDALPVTEQTGLPYASKQTARDKQGRDVGVMHACGHDMHMTCFVGTARWLGEHKDRWSGTVVLIGQPAEEAIGGAKNDARGRPLHAVPEARLRPGPALHAERAGGQRRSIGPGLLLASSTSVDMTIRGKGGHGAWPAHDGRPDRAGGPARSSTCRRSSAARSTRSTRRW